MNDKRKITDLLEESKGEGWFQENIVSHAPVIMAIFANFVVIVADVRVYDVIYRLTGSWWKALSSSLACAIPFILWEIAWQYNHTTDTWRKWSLGMAGLAFATSLFLGVADFLNFTGEFWTNVLLGCVVVFTGLHTVVGFLYYYNDPDVARRRRKAQNLAEMLDNQMNAETAEALLAHGSNVLAMIEQLEKRYSPEEVEGIMNILRGKRQEKPKQVMRPIRSFASTIVKPPENPTKGGE